MFSNFLPQAFGDMREDVNTLIQHDWSESAAATARQSNERSMERSWEFNSAEAQKQRDFSERMSNTSYQRAMNDMHRAGLNPMLAAKAGGADTPSGAAASGSGTSASPAYIPRGGNASSAMGLVASQVALNSASAVRTEAETDVARATAGEIRARTPVHAVSMDRMNQEIAESKERIDKIIAEARAVGQGERTSAAQQHYLEQQRRNLQAVLPQIQATVENLRAQTKLAGAHQSEVVQRVKVNLPAIERALKDLEEKARFLQMPMRGMDAAANDSFLGALGAVGRALNPFTNLGK